MYNNFVIFYDFLNYRELAEYKNMYDIIMYL